jgi:hypothetical protein
LVDIGIRFTVWPAHPKFFHSPKNNFDLFLAVITSIIQIPAIRDSNTYIYLSVFQVMRIYRPIIYIQSLKDLIVSSTSQVAIHDSMKSKYITLTLVFNRPS